MELREKVARAAYPLIMAGTDYDAVPIDEAFSRPRYFMLREQSLAVADAIIALCMEEAARLADEAAKFSEEPEAFNALAEVLRLRYRTAPASAPSE